MTNLEQPVILGPGSGGSEVTIGGPALVVVAGPCVIESEERTHRICAGLAEICDRLSLPLVFKASFDKANRTAHDAYRGPGLVEGLEILRAVGEAHGVALTTDVHTVTQVGPAAQVVDLLQIPAFLCRQTDLLVACGRSGRPVNVKKGQFQAPWDMGPVVDKVRSGGGPGIMVTERGTAFGYNTLVSDMRALPQLRALGVPVCFDATHSVQRPGALGHASGGDREMAPLLARAAVAAGVDAIFLEVHDDPSVALSDAQTQLPLGEVESLLGTLAEIHAISRRSPSV